MIRIYGKSLIVAGLILALFCIVTPLAQAGGWVAVTLDHLPMAPKAGESLHLGFMLRQHGLTPVNTNWENGVLKPYILASNKETKEELRFEARPEGAKGHFVVDVTFPSSGTWEWKLMAEPWYTFPEQFEPMTVFPAEVKAVEVVESEASPANWGWGIGLALVLVAGIGVAVQRKQVGFRLGLTLGLLGLVIVAGIFLGPLVISDASSVAAAKPEVSAPAVAPAAYGRALFVAKGCSSCHLHSEISDTVPGPYIGPNLTTYTNTPEYLHTWLKDPQALKPQTQMPNLGLKKVEIEALIAFLIPEPES